MKSWPSLRLELRASRLAPVLLGLAVLLALACTVTRPLGWPWLAAGVAAVLLVAGVALWRLRRDAGALLHLHGDGQWTLQRCGGPAISCRCERAAVLGPLIVLTLREHQGRHQRLVAWPDSLDPETRRQLRVWLRHALGRGAAEGLPNA